MNNEFLVISWVGVKRLLVFEKTTGWSLSRGSRWGLKCRTCSERCETDPYLLPSLCCMQVSTLGFHRWLLPQKNHPDSLHLLPAVQSMPAQRGSGTVHWLSFKSNKLGTQLSSCQQARPDQILSSRRPSTVLLLSSAQLPAPHTLVNLKKTEIQ